MRIKTTTSDATEGIHQHLQFPVKIPFELEVNKECSLKKTIGYESNV